MNELYVQSLSQVHNTKHVQVHMSEQKEVLIFIVVCLIHTMSIFRAENIDVYLHFIYVCMYVCMYVCLCVYMCVYMYD